MGRETVQKLLRDLARIFRIGHARLFRQRMQFKPIQQRISQPTEYAYLRIMHMGINEPRQHEAAAQIADVGR